ncbi:MAG: hypothetical protein SFY56_10780 [Bacteroidota bacterium]|nr:hypothetical protein [Bacteroidota bacterium]
MKQLRYIVKTTVFSLLMLLTISGFAQTDKLIRAQQLYNTKSVDAAKLAIDSVIQHPQTKGDFISWSTRAFIYFEIYKRTDKQKLNSELRDTIVSSLKTSMSLKPDADYESNNKKLLTSISINYYNLAKTLLQDSIKEKLSLKAYNKYKETFLLADSKASFLTKDVEYYNAVGSIYSDIYSKDRKNKEAQETAKIALFKVLELQPDNASANRNLGIMYCNDATGLIESLDYGADISQLDIIQENAVKLAKQAEQFMLKAYKSDEKNQSSLLGLYYIYRILSNQPKMDEFGLKCKNLGIKLDK